jgi:hypothetical protein
MKRCARILAVLACSAAVAGCGGGGASAPQTFPVKGKVVYKEGGQPMNGGSVQFVAATDANLNALGDIGADGSFTLSSFVANKKQAGAAEGSYKATITPPMGADQSTAPPVTLDGPFKVTAAGPNDFTLTVPGKPPKK